MTCAVIFTIEFALRTCVGTLDLRNLLLRDVTYWIDVACLLPFYLEIAMRASSDVVVAGNVGSDVGGGAVVTAADPFELPLAFKILQLLRLLRVLKLLRHYSGWRVLLVALHNSWRALLVPGFAMLLTVLILAGCLFLAEQDVTPSQILSSSTSNATALMRGAASSDGGSGELSAEGFRDGWETMWVCFWLVATLGYDGYLGSGAVGGQVVIAVALVCGLLFTTMPITIMCVQSPLPSLASMRQLFSLSLSFHVWPLAPPSVPPSLPLIHLTLGHMFFRRSGEAFRAAWEKKELIEVQMRIQELLIDRGLALSELHRIFAEFDTSGDMQLDWGEFKRALRKLNVSVDLAKMRKLFAMFDEDETGQVDYMEFCRLLYPNVDLSALPDGEADGDHDDEPEETTTLPISMVNVLGSLRNVVAPQAAGGSSVKVHPSNHPTTQEKSR